MTRDEAVYAVCILDEALLLPETRRKYGGFGVAYARNAVEALCEEYKLDKEQLESYRFNRVRD